MNRSKVAFIKRDFHVSGGLEKVTHHLLKAFLDKGANLSFFTASSATPPCPTYTYRPNKLLPKFLQVGQINAFDQWAKEKLSASSFDIIFSMDRGSIQTHHRAGNGVHAAYLDLRSFLEGPLRKVSFALNPLHRLHLKLEKLTFESETTQAIIVNSALVKKQILSYYKTPPSKIHIIHNGVEWKEVEEEFNDSMVHRKKYLHNLGLNPSVFHFLFVGHNFERKGLKTLLQALPLVSKGSNQNFHLSVVGSDKKLPFYQSLTRKLKLENQVSFFGAVPTSKPFFLASDALIIPSIYDPFANVTVEALALGLFVISSKMNGGHEVLQSHSGITLENSQNPEELASALEKALDHPKELLRARAIRDSIAHLDYSLQLEKICQLCLG